jgi:hypothetical protein
LNRRPFAMPGYYRLFRRYVSASDKMKENADQKM